MGAINNIRKTEHIMSTIPNWEKPEGEKQTDNVENNKRMYTKWLEKALE